MTNPNVSVMMPCYNSKLTLARAIASVILQSFEDWELVLVDDGSTDTPFEVVEAVADARIRYIRLERNRGRGFARQVALQQCRGSFLCMLDADDWMYPKRIEEEVEFLQRAQSVVVVSAGMAITRPSGQLTGIRSKGTGQIQGPFRSLHIPFAFPPSMIRMEAIGNARFDETLKRGQDADFILQVLRGRKFCVLDSVNYAYVEDERDAIVKSINSHPYVRARYRKHIRDFPALAPLAIVQSYFAESALRVGSRLNADGYLLDKRVKMPSMCEIELHREALRSVSELAERIMPSAFGSIGEW